MAGRSPSGGGGDGVAMLFDGCVLPLPIGDWVQDCVSPRLQSGAACLAERLGHQGGGSEMRVAPEGKGHLPMLAEVQRCFNYIAATSSSLASQAHRI